MDRNASVFALAAFTFLPPAAWFSQWRGQNGWEMGPGMMGWGILAWTAPLLMLIFWVAIIVAIIFLIRWLMASARTHRLPGHPEDSALEILKKRYARGEISKEEFEEKKRDLL